MRFKPETLLLLGCSSLLFLAGGTAQASDWTEYAGDKHASRYLADGLATKSSVKNMKVAWRYRLPDAEFTLNDPDLRTWVN